MFQQKVVEGACSQDGLDSVFPVLEDWSPEDAEPVKKYFFLLFW
jgi:hypothetical protein